MATSRLAWLRHFNRRDWRFVKQLFGEPERAILPAPQRPEPATWPDDALTCAWLGHATVLINFFGITILTDPVLGARIGLRFGPLTIGPKRYVAPALTVSELPPLDLVLLTHAHMDHLDRWTLRRLPPGAQALTARATADLLSGARFTKIHELDWNDTCKIEPRQGAVGVRAFRVQHWGARMLHDEYRGYNGYLLERHGRRLCLAGDTARTDFTPLAAHGKIDAMVVPIGAYNPWIHAHCNPEEAVAMANEAGAHYLLPIHHQTFKLSAEPMMEPLARFTNALANEPERLGWSEIGATFRLP